MFLGAQAVGALARVAIRLRDPVSYRLGRRLELPCQLSRCTSGPNQLDHLLSECRRVRRSRLRHCGLLLLLLAKRIGVHEIGSTPASLEREPGEVVAEALLEAERHDPERVKHWVVLVDGAETQLDLVEAGAAACGVDVTVILDIIHVVEYVWKAAHVFHPEGSPELACWAWTRVRDILEGKARRVASSMRRAATVAGLSPDARKPVDTCADYLLKYAPYLHYDRYLAAGYPIATGVVEGACRHLVRDRMELTGARWRLVGAEAVLKLRALRASGDFDAYWDFHEAREYERNHAQRYAGGKAPPVTEPPPPPSSPRLRRVK